MTTPIAPRPICPPGACICGLEGLLDTTDADLRILRLTRLEEKKLIARLEAIESLAELERLQFKMQEQLGIRLDITPSHNEVRSFRGIGITVLELPGLCRKTRQNIPAAIRRALDKHPEIIYALLNANDLLRDA
ncbi:MAG: hypothetical protein PW845_30265 [Pseudomonas sp.]|uniref:hypothetical protein n=1 Tax=Pseudomonas abieticivorans TaxID=2931382 RepID=UPI0020BE079B|nr:hypothetical protein [Pseudomonas sp. PIA16]MDE1169551.1 hypothetical protein [Pseudomonas sp.]